MKVKLAVIINLEFSQTLIQLKKYLNMTDYLQQYISHYVIIVKSLQLCKILLNQRICQNHEKNHEKEVTVSKNKRKRLTDYINIVKFTSKKLNIFQHL